jgi:hypothetical protein
VQKQCLFCPSPVDSAGHLWSDWILRDLKATDPIKVIIGRRPSVFIATPEVLVECVCKNCNNRWMGNLETRNQPFIHAMINDDPCWLSKKDQKKLVRSALLKAMVIEATNEQRPFFYSNEEREQIKSDSGILLERLFGLVVFRPRGFTLLRWGTDIWGQINEVPKAVHGCVTSMVMGHLLIQVLSGHVLPASLLEPRLPWAARMVHRT